MTGITPERAVAMVVFFVAWFARYEFSGSGGVRAYRVDDDDGDYARRLRATTAWLPRYAFALAWSVLYTLNALASYAYWAHQQEHHNGTAVWLLWLVNLAANKLWSTLFFDRRAASAALADIVVVLGSALALVALFAADGALAAVLLWLPYVAWLLLATVLNVRFVMMD